jgi:4-aminobutyrate aminotransferase/(S)-3-amino-2-methylpropionate transaminase
VQTGFARTGTMFASEQFGIVPDLIVTAKGIAGGLPLSAVTGRAEMMDAPQLGGLGGTYGGNPLACVAALATIETYETENLAGRAREIGAILFEKLGALRDADPRIAEVRGRGAMVAIELVDPATGDPDAALTSKIAAAAHAAGVILLTCGTYGNVIRFLPPLSIPDHLLIEGLDVVAEAVAKA